MTSLEYLNSKKPLQVSGLLLCCGSLLPIAIGWFISMATVSAVGVLVYVYYWKSIPDWMDAKIPSAVTSSMHAVITCLKFSLILIGILGWIRYAGIQIRLRSVQEQNEDVP